MAESDNTIQPAQKHILIQIADGQNPVSEIQARPLLPISTKLYLSAKEAAKALNIGTTKFYEVRNRYPELRPTRFGGKPQYSSEAILRLFDRLQRESIKAQEEATTHAS
jgi:hypothetical protein